MKEYNPHEIEPRLQRMEQKHSFQQACGPKLLLQADRTWASLHF